MQVTINDTSYEVPFTLENITLAKFIEYHKKYGNDLDKQAEITLKRNYPTFLSLKWEVPVEEITEEDIELHKQIDIDNLLDNEAIAWYSFWTGLDLKEAKDQPAILPVLSQYRILKTLLNQEVIEAREFPKVIEWNGEEWEIQNYTVNSSSEMTTNEVLTSKEVVKQIMTITKGRWDALPYLCAIFLRKKGEVYQDSFISEKSERLELINSLPIKHGLTVAFFLNVCVNTWKTITHASDEKEPVNPNLN